MQINEPKYNADGSIDCILDHPEFGLVPFTARGDSDEPHVAEIWAALMERNDVAPYEAPAPTPGTSMQVDAERDRRLAAGVTVDVEGYGPVPVQGRQVDQTNLLALKDTARDLIAASITAPVIEFRDGANVMHSLTPAQMVDLANKGKAAAAEIYAAAWALKDNPPIPADYAADAYWP